MSDEPDRKDLEDRVDQLESTISKMLPSRRDALKLGGAALVGGAAMSGSASAGTQQAGTIGTSGSPVDVESEDINNADTVTTENLVVNNTATGPFGGGGIIFEEGDPINERRGSFVSVSADSFFNIFDLGSPVDVYGGAVYGNFASVLRITFGTGTTIKLGNGNDLDAGRDRAGDQFSVQPIFPMQSVSKLEVFNDRSATQEYGFQVYTT
jgi:hypothetical protein